MAPIPFTIFLSPVSHNLYVSLVLSAKLVICENVVNRHKKVVLMLLVNSHDCGLQIVLNKAYCK